ncbi:MAG: fatty acid desaturase [Alphaproteobacteria bacterium]|jgi:fatty acid desaturase
MRANDLLTPDQLEAVRARHDWKAVGLVLHAWTLIFGAMALFVWWPNVVTFLVAAAIIGGRQLGLAILMHDGAHGLLLKNHGQNMWVSQWLLAYPVGTDAVLYRRYHLKHHARTQQEDDPDLVLSQSFPVTKKSLGRKIVRDLTGQTGLSQRFAQFRDAVGKPGQTFAERFARARDKVGGIVISNVVLFAVLAMAGYWWLYPVLWLVPLLTFFQVFLRLRNIAEHAMVGDKDDPFVHARTTLVDPLTGLFLAPYWVNYHVEHHLLMWVPCYNLSKFHRFLKEGEHRDRMLVEPSYMRVFRLVTARAEDNDPGGGKGRIHGERRRYSGIVMEEDAA